MISQRLMVAASLAAVHQPDTYMRVARPREEPARGFQPATCACGHPAGDHRTAGGQALHQPRHGVCLITGCSCRGFQTPRTIPGTPRHA